MNLKIKIGAITIAIGIDGTNLLILVNMNIPNPRTNQIPGKYLCLNISDLIIHFLKDIVPVVVGGLLTTPLVHSLCYKNPNDVDLAA
ncbi:MAG: hypothetical protein ACW963_06170 [Candidatus Sifarchaeia archaeon]